MDSQPIFILSILLICLSFSYLIELPEFVDKELWEIFLQIVTVTLLLISKKFKEPTSLLIACIGCVLSLHCVSFVTTNSQLENALNYTTAICSYLWAIIAFWHNSELIGCAAVVSFFCACDFILSNISLHTPVGFSLDDRLLRVVVISGTLAMFYTWLILPDIKFPRLKVFRTGTAIMGFPIFFIVSLLLTSSMYHNFWPWLFWNFLYVISLSLCFFFGSSLTELNDLCVISKVFGVVFLTLKWIEITWDETLWPLGVFGIGSLLYYISVFYLR